MDALAGPKRRTNGQVDESAAGHFLDLVSNAIRTRAPTVGRGGYEVLSGDVVGAELRVAGQRVHLSAFPFVEEEGRDHGLSADPLPMAPPSLRRRWIG